MYGTSEVGQVPFMCMTLSLQVLLLFFTRLRLNYHFLIDFTRYAGTVTFPKEWIDSFLYCGSPARSLLSLYSPVQITHLLVKCIKYPTMACMEKSDL